MPELPEVEVLRRSLAPHLIGTRIESVLVRDGRLREPIATRAFETALPGATVERLDRRAKYLLICLSTGTSLVLHLGMSGRLVLSAPDRAAEPHEHFLLALSSGRCLRFRDPRRFGLAVLVRTSELPRDRHFRHLGVEPLAEEFSGEALRRSAAGRRAPVKSFLMDGRVVVGVGNIYASEALHRAGIHPLRSVSRISSARWDRLAESVQEVLLEAIEAGGTTLNDFADGEGRSGYFQVDLKVYDRAGQPCGRCGGMIRRRVLSGRSTYYCPGCQR